MDHLHTRLSIPQHSYVATMAQIANRKNYDKTKALPTGETVKHLLPLPHKYKHSPKHTLAHTHTHTHTPLTKKEQDAGAAFESCPVAVNINSRWHVNIVPFWFCVCERAPPSKYPLPSHVFSPSIFPTFPAWHYGYHTADCSYCHCYCFWKCPTKA